MADKLGRPLLFLACRYHILERHITHFNKIYPSSKTSGLENQLFKHLKSVWNDLEKDIVILKRIETPNGTWINKQHLEAEKFYRDVIDNRIYKKDGKSRKDYQELAELSLMVVSQKDRFKFRISIHHTRFMSKALYYLKMYLLLEAIPSLSEENKKKICEMAMFVGIFYTQWFLRAVSATAVPY
ncbi:uncharacterized protein LOC124809292 [Hydra vulgaris]|uniref:uncharacterized protein LOC124809292 n=1 Tax=Hydra vulgaris TaxID=6087 RepID=UPI001F5F71E2|nr:uncharacterized protein LOC124809292 [Hydra vulgaris]